MMKKQFPLLASIGGAAALCSGCASLDDWVDLDEASRLVKGAVSSMTGVQAQTPPELVPPENPPLPPDRSAVLLALGNVSADIDASTFPETFDVSTGGISGVAQSLGTFPLRELVAKSFGTAVSLVFRVPVPGEVPVVRIVPEITKISSWKTGPNVETSIAGKIRLVWLDDDGFERSELFALPVDARGISGWVPGRIPTGVYDALNRMSADFLDALKADRLAATRLERVAAGWDPDSDTKRPTAPEIVAFTMKNGSDASRVVGECSVACNDWESSQTASWAKSRIFGQCADKLDLDKDRIRVVYDVQTFDSGKKVWNFSFWALSRLPLAIQYSEVDRKGVCVVDLQLLGGTAADAEKQAKAYVMQSMNHRAGVVADDVPDAKADVRFGNMTTDTRLGLLTLPFQLDY